MDAGQALTETEFAVFLEDISRCFTDADFALWATCIRLPFSLVTQTGPVTLESEAALRSNFDLYLQAMAIMQVDLVARRAISVEVCDPDTVICTYETELLSRGTRARAPYTSSALLHRTGSGWRMSSIMNALGHHHWTGVHPYPTGETK